MTNADEVLTALLRWVSKEERDDTTTYPERKQEALKALNSAMQVVAAQSPSWFDRNHAGAKLEAPTTVTATRIDAQAISILDADWQAWMEGSTVQTGGVIDNSGDYVSAAAGGSRTLQLLHPHLQTDATFAVVFYHDCIILPTTYRQMLRPVRLPGFHELVPVTGTNGLDSAANATQHINDYGSHLRIPSVSANSVNRTDYAGAPRAYFVDTKYSTDAAQEFRLRLSPPPAVEMILDYKYRVNPPKYEIDTDSEVLPIPHQWVETILFPIALKRFTTAPWFRNKSHIESIKEDYAEAMNILGTITPQNRSGVRLPIAF